MRRKGKFGTRAAGQDKKTPPAFAGGVSIKTRPRPTLPHSCPCSTIGAERLNFRVRNGNGCGPFAIKTGNSKVSIKLTIELVRSSEEKNKIKPRDSLVPVS